MVSVSPRLRDSLDYEEPDTIDPRLSASFRSLSIGSTDYDRHDPRPLFERAFAANPDPAATRRKRRQRNSDRALDHAVPFQYRTIADGDAFRLVVLLPGTGNAPVECSLLWESSNHPQRDYLCLSYCWGEAKIRDAAILCDGYRFSVTRNLLMALQNVRKPTTNVLIWVDQICINQEDLQERGHQVSIMKQIFSHAKEVIVWLGEEDDRSKKLYDYAKKMRRGEDNGPRNVLRRILSARQLQDAMQKLLQRPWFSRVWVIPEVALAKFTIVQCGRSQITWDNLVRLIQDTQLPQTPSFNKQSALLGNTRQRIAIITQMIASRRASLYHTDITQLLILAKASQATEVRDMVYAFYGLTLLTTFPDYERPVERLYSDIALMYVNSIRWEDYYSRWHGLNEMRRVQQLMSILYSAGKLHQHLSLPSWVPDWTFAWHLAPIWCKTTSNIVIGTAKDEWCAGIRSEYRAGGDKLETFEVIEERHGMHQLHVSALVFDSILTVSETTPASTPSLADHGPVSPTEEIETVESPTLRYGRSVFETKKGLVGLATPGVEMNDVLAIPLGGDVPVVLRLCSSPADEGTKAYQLLCECFIQSEHIMKGDLIHTDWLSAQDIILV